MNLTSFYSVSMATADGSNRVPGSVLSPRLFDTPLAQMKYIQMSDFCVTPMIFLKPSAAMFLASARWRAVTPPKTFNMAALFPCTSSCRQESSGF